MSESYVKGLEAPRGLTIDIKPSPRQYELWKLLEPNRCPHCGGTIQQSVIGYGENGRAIYKPQCSKCGTFHLPQLILGGGAAGGGKALTISSLVCTPFGFRPLKDLKIGDIISNPMTGGQQRITWIHPKGTFDFYRIHFVDGTYTDCSEGHLWRLRVGRKKSKKAKHNPEHYAMYGDDRLWPAKKMYDWYQDKKGGKNKGAHLIIPLTKPVEFSVGGCGTGRPIDPYILGAIIGNGCIGEKTISKNCVRFSVMDDEIKQRFIDDMSKYHTKTDSQAIHYTIYNNDLVKAVKDLGITGNPSRDRFIPRPYLLAPIKDRIKLMQGLMDTDGYVDDRGHMSYTSISKQLAEDVAFIVRSLGGVATVTTNKAGYKDPRTGEFVQCNDAWNVQIRTKMNPDLCGLTRKKERARYDFNGGNSELGKRITDVEYIGKQESFCISVDDPSGLYITDNFTVTHNSFIGSCWICSTCIRFPDIRAVIARKTAKSLKESTFNTVKSVLRSWGLIENKHFKINNVENWLMFWNGSIIYLKELETLPSDPNFERLGSTEITVAFCDEVSEISEKAIETLMSRCRWKVSEYMGYPRLLMTTNPCATWVRSRFVQDDDGNPVKLADTDAFVRFSVYDNPCEDFVKVYENNLRNIKDPAVRARLLYGNWDFIDANVMAAYSRFDGNRHLVSMLKEKVYDPMKPIISGWDFNVAPYMSELEVQIDYEKKKVYVLGETVGKPDDKENNTPKMARKVRDKLLAEGHLGGVVITGDPAGLSRSTQTEEGVNNYTIIEGHMSNTSLRPKTKLLAKQPPQAVRLEFVNSVFDGYHGWEVQIDMRCRRLTEDMIYQQKNGDGTKMKKKVVNPNTGVKEEKYGHMSDILDYVLVYFLGDEWKKFQNLGARIDTYTAPVSGTFEY